MKTLPKKNLTKPAHAPWTTGGIFDPNGPDPRTNIWGRRPRGAQSGEIIAHDVRLNDAEFIVRACNAHDELVAALKAIVYRTPAGNALFHKLTEEHAEAALAALAKAESTP